MYSWYMSSTPMGCEHPRMVNPDLKEKVEGNWQFSNKIINIELTATRKNKNVYYETVCKVQLGDSIQTEVRDYGRCEARMATKSYSFLFLYFRFWDNILEKWQIGVAGPKHDVDYAYEIVLLAKDAKDMRDVYRDLRGTWTKKKKTLSKPI